MMVAHLRALYTFFTTAGHHNSLCFAHAKSPLLKALETEEEEEEEEPDLPRVFGSLPFFLVEGVEMKQGRSSESSKSWLKRESSAEAVLSAQFKLVNEISDQHATVQKLDFCTASTVQKSFSSCNVRTFGLIGEKRAFALTNFLRKLFFAALLGLHLFLFINS